MKEVTEMVNQDSDTSSVRTTSLAHVPVNANTSAKLTVLTSEYPKFLTKKIALDDKGNMVKIPSAHLTKGRAEVVHIQSLQEFSQLLQGLEHCQALAYGVPKGALKAKVVTKKAFESLSDTENAITRSNDHFEWPKGPGIMMFDYDPDGEALDKDAVLQLLYDVCPEVKDTDHLWWTSSSSNIRNEETGEQLSGVTGQRVYFMVKNASDILRTAEVIAKKLWLANKGYFKITKSGSVLERVPFDMTVYQPCRLDFAAGASTSAPLTQDRGQPYLIKGTNNVLDTRATLPDLDEDKQALLDVNKRGQMSISVVEAGKVKAKFIAEQTKRIVTIDPSLLPDDVADVISKTLETSALPPYWPLHVWHGDALVEVTVAEVLTQKYTYHGSLCLDPLEPEYDGGRLVGKLYLDQSMPCINSFARGGQAYSLNDYTLEIYLHANLHNATNDTLDILEQRMEVFNYGGSLAIPIKGKLCVLDRTLMLHLLSGLITYLDKKENPCDPSVQLVEGVLTVGAKKDINPITGFVDHPIIDSKLRLLSKKGYDKLMELLGVFDHSKFDFSDSKLSPNEVTSNLTRLYAPFTEFDLAGPDDKSILVAAIFSAVVRQALPTCPAFGFDAPMQGSGKTLLAETIAIIGSGEKAPALAPGRSDYDEEFRKRLLTLLMAGEKVCLFDNIVGAFDSPSFAAALTSGVYQDRILRTSRSPKVLVKTLFLMTGNNLTLTGDMSRRVLRARLKPDNHDLTKREYSFDPVVKATAMRKQIICSVLSLINHWKHCGQPRQSGSMTSFSEWDTLVRQPLAFIATQLPQSGLVDVLDVSVRQQGDNGDKEALIALLISLASSFGINQRFKAGEVHNFYKVADHNHIADAILAFRTRDQLQSSQKIGNLLREFVDRNVDGLVLRSSRASGSLSYRVELTEDTHKQSIEQLTPSRYYLSASNDSKVG